MSAMDDLYGEGASATLRDVLPGRAKVEQIALAGDAVRINIRWPNAEMKIEATATEWLFLSLVVDTDRQREGLYSKCVAALSELTRDFGVERWLATAADEGSADVLMRRGGWERSGRKLTWDL